MIAACDENKGPVTKDMIMYDSNFVKTKWPNEKLSATCSTERVILESHSGNLKSYMKKLRNMLQQGLSP